MNKILDSIVCESIAVGTLIGIATFILIATVLIFAHTIDNASEQCVVTESQMIEMLAIDEDQLSQWRDSLSE